MGSFNTQFFANLGDHTLKLLQMRDCGRKHNIIHLREVTILIFIAAWQMPIFCRNRASTDLVLASLSRAQRISEMGKQTSSSVNSYLVTDMEQRIIEVKGEALLLIAHGGRNNKLVTWRARSCYALSEKHHVRQST